MYDRRLAAELAAAEERRRRRQLEETQQAFVRVKAALRDFDEKNTTAPDSAAAVKERRVLNVT